MKKRIILAILSLIFLLSSCKGMNTSKKSNNISIANTMGILTSDKCAGRLAGTQGNKEAEKYIEECFNKIGLEKFDGSYLHEYSHEYWKPLKENYKMSFIFSNGEVIECKYGEDFIENFMANVDIKAPLAFNEKDKNINDCVLVVEKSKTVRKNMGSPKAVLIKTGSFRCTPSAYNENYAPSIQISPKLYELLKGSGGTEVSIKFECNAVKEEIPQNNVVGLIKGENNKNAIVISAHFDHAGSKMGKIWRGAIDNASGTSVLIDIAQRVHKESQKNKLKQDIIFCAFNGEEDYLQGSTAFVNKINSKYDNIYNINIDCVGLKGGKKLGICNTETSNRLKNDISNHLKEEGIDVDLKQVSVSSDHQAFEIMGICAVELMQGFDVSVIHTLKDDLSRVDFHYLEKLSQSIANYLIKNSDKIYTSDEKNTETVHRVSMTKEDEAIMKEGEKLKFNQYKFIKLGNDIRVVDKKSEILDKAEDFEKLYPKHKIPSTLGDLKLFGIMIIDNSKEHIRDPLTQEQIKNHEIGKVYTIKTLFENLEDSQFIYRKTEGKKILKEVIVEFTVYDKKDKLQMMFNEELASGGLEKSFGGKISPQNINVDGLKYQIVYDESNTAVKGLYMAREDKNKICHIRILSGQDDWPYKTKEETIDIVKAFKLSPFVKGILDPFFK